MSEPTCHCFNQLIARSNVAGTRWTFQTTTTTTTATPSLSICPSREASDEMSQQRTVANEASATNRTKVSNPKPVPNSFRESFASTGLKPRLSPKVLKKFTEVSFKKFTSFSLYLSLAISVSFYVLNTLWLSHRISVCLVFNT